jgi:uncharacterized protein
MHLQPSKHNIISPVEGTGEHIILNLLSDNADIISDTEVSLLQGGKFNDLHEDFINKGYLVNPAQEEINYRLKYIEFLEEREKEEIQLFFVPTYACNFTCSYCYQSDYPAQKPILKKEIIDSFFHFVRDHFRDKKKYITLFGGEPLLPSPAYIENITRFIKKAEENNLSLAIVTNGYHLDHYLHLFTKVNTREIQVTLDGTEKVHNERRRLKNGGDTFKQIVHNIDACLEKGIPVNLRMVIDKHNIDDLPKLAGFAIEKGWTDHPGFKTQIGRNYELHYCQTSQSKLFDRLTLYKEIYSMIQKFPHITRFYSPAFSVMKFLFENGSLPSPLFDACPACKSEWAMDYTGSIYSCTATVGKPGEKLGTFYPEVFLEIEKIKNWQRRDVMSIEKCRDCNVQLICGGGCGSLAFNKNNSIHSPDCRPITELIGLGAKAYFVNHD